MIKHTAFLFMLATAVFSAAQSSSAVPVPPPGTEGLEIIVTGNGDVIARFEGSDAGYSNDLYLLGNATLIFNNQTSAVGSTFNLGSFPIGTVLTFRVHVGETGLDFFSGPASLNPHNHPHARVQVDFAPGTSLVTFEDLVNGDFDYNDIAFSFTNTGQVVHTSLPATAALMLAGLGLFGVAFLLQRRHRPRARR